MKKRIVITGMGAVTPYGVGVNVLWQGVSSGKSCIGSITHFDAEGYASRIAGQVPAADAPNGFNAEEFVGRKDQKKMARFIQLGMAASIEAVKQAGLEEVEDALGERIGVVLGSGVGGLPEIEATKATLDARGPSRVSPFYIPSILVNLLSGQVSMKYGFKGPNSSVVTACATGAHAIGTAMRMIEHGEADIVVAGGAEAAICPTSIAGFASAKALSTSYNDTPEKASRPFDEGRDGFVMSEGAGVLVLESEESAKARGAVVLGELAGFGQAGDAYHLTMPCPDGSGGIRAMKAALADAGIKAEDVDYVNAHATSTPAGDKTESQSIEKTFGSDILVSATKSMTGHMLGAAGSVEAIICALTLKEGVIAPTINLENPSEGCTLDYIPNEARKVEGLNVALSNSFGFGGTNATLVFKKV